ncbi:MAG: hypothetical protein IT378_22375 [Sandaracinaceae bacterium]|nr:hypothetical protein [Sandaracinaceae bacterium]
MKIFLDDERPIPSGWTGARWPSDVIELLEKGGVTHLSLDHDLGDAEDAIREGRTERTGYDVLVWLEERVFHDPGSPIPVISIHSANAAGRGRMQRAIESIARRRSR